MKRKLLFITIFMLVFLPTLAFANPTSQVKGSVGIVKACGEAMTMGAKEAVHRQALEKAKQAAVYKAIARFTPPDSNPKSAFRKACAEYQRFVVGVPTVFKEQVIKGKKQLYCDVQVNFTAIKNYLQELNETEQMKQLDDSVFFWVRVTGLENSSVELQQRLFKDSWGIFQNSFKEQGLESQDRDVDKQVIENFEQYKDVASYIKAIEENLKEQVDVSLAVIGEIKLVSSSVDTDGSALAEANCLCKIVRNGNDINNPNNMETIGLFENTYYFKRPTKEEAERMVVQKAAYNASKYLVSEVVNYWREHPSN
ncbi:MAG: hypothetical protein Q4D21_10430 [Phascolarctobacterium sp.]|nr:hypothetical protein [Phascolarctobacterium sp.]